MASISRHKNKWRAIIHRKHIYKSKVFDTKAKAETWARRTETQIDDGEYVDRDAADNLPLNKALQRYIKEVSINKRGRGYECEKSVAGILSATRLGRFPLSKIKPADVVKIRDEFSEVVGANTVRLRLTLLSHLFTIAQTEWGMDYLRNPVKSIRKPSLKGTARDRRLMPGEETSLLDAATEYGHPHPAIIALAIETAMREGELAEFRWEHVRLSDKVIYLPKEITKNNEDRDVPLSSRAVEILRSIPRRLDGKVIGIKANSISQAFGRICNRTKDAEGNPAPIEDLHFHDLRHEATSRLFEKGLDSMQVAAITGHKTLQMLKRYTHLRAEDLAKMLG